MTADANAHLPPKSCTIDKLVTISADIQKVLNGKKKATRRNARYADIGEEMILEGERFVVHNVYSQKLGEMNDLDAVEEGYDSLKDYQDAILSIHPGMKWSPKVDVWVHEYKPVANM